MPSSCGVAYSNRMALWSGFTLAMKSKDLGTVCLLVAISSVLTLAGCHGAKADQAAEDPPPPKIVPGADINLFPVDHPEQFPFATAAKRPGTPELVVTGTF